MSVFFKIGIFLYSRAESQIFNITLSYFWIEMEQSILRDIKSSPKLLLKHFVKIL